MEKKPILMYLCDPNKNTKCRKSACQTECFHTQNYKYAKDVPQVFWQLAIKTETEKL